MRVPKDAFSPKGIGAWNRRRALAALSLIASLVAGCSGAEHRPPMATHPLAVLHNSPDADERIAAYRRLGRETNLTSRPRELAIYYLTLGSKGEASPLAREAATLALAGYRDPEATTALREAVNDDSPMVRAAACKSLGKQRSIASLDIFTGLATHDPDPSVRQAAVEAMAELQHQLANEPLAQRVNDDDVVVAQTALEGLRKFNGVNFGADIQQWRDYFARQKEVAENPASRLAPASTNAIIPQ